MSASQKGAASTPSCKGVDSPYLLQAGEAVCYPPPYSKGMLRQPR